jgi:hypothetical protein
MFTLSKTHPGQMKGGRALFRKRIWLRILGLAGLGAMVLTVLCLLPGCGSDSIPEGSVKGKNAKTATKSKLKKMQEPISLLADKYETGSGKMGKIKHKPESNFVEPIPGVTQEELDVRAAADRKILESPDTEVFPGMTQAELEARLAADSSFDPKTAEVFPGMTQVQLDAKNAKQEVPHDRELFPPAVGK